MDILVMTNEPTVTGCLIEARPVGILRMQDEEGRDEKVLAVPIIDPFFNEIKEIDHVAPQFPERSGALL
jgi:inorganic pyrophosphatase